MSANLPRCPVCRGVAWESRGGNIYRHRDKAGTVCPASGQPHYITDEYVPLCERCDQVINNVTGRRRRYCQPCAQGKTA